MGLKKQIFPVLLKNGQIFNSRNMSLRIMPDQQTIKNLINQVSFVVSTKVSKLATVRNLLKRRGRAIIVKHKENIKTPYFLAFFIKSGAVNLSFSDFEKEVLYLLNLAKIK